MSARNRVGKYSRAWERKCQICNRWHELGIANFPRYKKDARFGMHPVCHGCFRVVSRGDIDYACEQFLADEDAFIHRYLRGADPDKKARNRAKDPFAARNTDQFTSLDEALKVPVDPSTWPDAHVYTKEVLSAVRQALEVLEKVDRDLLLANILDSYTIRTLASRHGMTRMTVQRRIQRSLESVRCYVNELLGN